MSRWLSWLSELQPEMFCEVSPELAHDIGLKNGGWATISSARGEIEARVLVTERMQPLKMGRRFIHQIGLPYHWGNTGLVKGDSTNELLAFGADRERQHHGIESDHGQHSPGQARPPQAQAVLSRFCAR